MDPCITLWSKADITYTFLSPIEARKKKKSICLEQFGRNLSNKEFDLCLEIWVDYAKTYFQMLVILLIINLNK